MQLSPSRPFIALTEHSTPLSFNYSYSGKSAITTAVPDARFPGLHSCEHRFRLSDNSSYRLIDLPLRSMPSKHGTRNSQDILDHKKRDMIQNHGLKPQPPKQNSPNINPKQMTIPHPNPLIQTPVRLHFAVQEHTLLSLTSQRKVSEFPSQWLYPRPSPVIRLTLLNLRCGTQILQTPQPFPTAAKTRN